ncbi:hypothetical protein B296_00022727 [Ensete ventricosum]|uniref:AT-hook motif nuclear-localized protein n=1 Tax=Ensete ventricosum TaxID=4639 RepID=A0A426ZTT3_ENSVE|nr:hypothetical protein B296_00022727 [Ensete ventricosum]
MEGMESVVVTGCEGGRGGDEAGGGGAEAVHSAPTLSPTPPQLAAFSSGVVGVTGMPVPPSEGAGLAMGMMGSGGYGGSSEGDLPARKKRGRPRKYGSDSMALALSPTSGSTCPFPPASSDAKRGRGRPPGSGKRQLLSALDVNNCTFAILFQGRFEILSLSGSFTITETGGIRGRTGGISVSLAGPDGRVIGGGVAGLLLAAIVYFGVGKFTVLTNLFNILHYQVVVGSFMPNAYKEKQAKPTHQAQPSALPGTTGLLTAAMPISQANPEEDCETPTSSSLPGQSHAENSMCGPNPNSTWHGLHSSEHKPSPDINICLQGE